MKMFDVVIIGGGHAGSEAAWIASQFDIKVGIISLEGVGLASTPCNPSIGGVGKGQVVRELDALGGFMPLVADLSAIQYRTLNDSKGFAVQSTRVQVDKDLYTANAERLISENENIEVVRGKVQKVIKLDGLFEITLDSGVLVKSKKAVVTTGTFLNGKLHTGANQSEGGRVGAQKSDALDNIFAGVSKLNKRFKTGTPPRLDRKTIDWSVMEPQESDAGTRNFSSLHLPFARFAKQTHCHLTRTNLDTMTIIRENKERSPMFNGQIVGVGPRYCPSIEDKAFRYPDRNTHHVFVEPEGHDAETIYPNGISTSLPLDIQEKIIQSIKGLENAKILVPGYAVEYDVVDTTTLKLSLESKEVEGLYFAGQVNGTSGYEEAAGQGYIAGVNAALNSLSRDYLVLDRNDSYIGVMIEDLVTNKRDEPYRLFTARSENRLYIREDNSINRIFPYRQSLNLNKEIDSYQKQYINHFEILTELCRERIDFDGEKNVLISELLKRPENHPIQTLEKVLLHFGLSYSIDVISAVAISCKYEGYINRAEVENERMKKLGMKKISWPEILESPNISFECKLRIKEIKPETFSQLKNIEGIRPATLAFVANVLTH